MSEPERIHDMIQTFDTHGHPELVTQRLLKILDAMNERMEEIYELLQDHVYDRGSN